MKTIAELNELLHSNENKITLLKIAKIEENLKNELSKETESTKGSDTELQTG